MVTTNYLCSAYVIHVYQQIRWQIKKKDESDQRVLAGMLYVIHVYDLYATITESG